MEGKPSFFSITPAVVRYDKRLSANAKLLFGEIVALSMKTGACFAGNAYFASLYGVSERSIKIWMNLLEKCGYIYRLVGNSADGVDGKARQIVVTEPEAKGYIDSERQKLADAVENTPARVNETSREGGKNLPGEGEKIFTHNNTRDNKTSLNIPPINNPPLENRKQKGDLLADVPEPLKEAMQAFVEYRKASRKPMTKYAVKLMVDKLEEQCSTDAERIDCINESILRGWSGVYPRSGGNQNNRGYGKKQEWKAPDATDDYASQLTKRGNILIG